MRLLLVEDDHELSERLSSSLVKEGYAVDSVDNGEDGCYAGESEDYDCAILDLGLPGINGLEVLKRWRHNKRSMPVLILTARSAWTEKVIGLKSGADDYLTKPFHPEELVARIQALIRRSHGQSDRVITQNNLLLDEEQQTVSIDDNPPIELTGTEFRLLRYFMLNAGRVLSKTRLTEHVYDMDFDRDSNVIEVYVRRLRDKIGREHIETKRGQGYVFKA